MRNKNVARVCLNKMNDWLLCCIDIQLCDTNFNVFHVFECRFSIPSSFVWLSIACYLLDDCSLKRQNQLASSSTLHQSRLGIELIIESFKTDGVVCLALPLDAAVFLQNSSASFDEARWRIPDCGKNPKTWTEITQEIYFLLSQTKKITKYPYKHTSCWSSVSVFCKMLLGLMGMTRKYTGAWRGEKIT